MKRLEIQILILLFFCSNFIFSQKKENKTTVYMKINHFMVKYKKDKLTNKDSLNIKIINNDTLIKVENYRRPKGISVEYEYKDSVFLNLYKEVAFYHKNDSTKEKTTMKYWKKPIKLFFSKSINRKTKKKFLKFTNYLSENIDSLNISVVKKIEKSNYIIYYQGDFEYESRLNNYKSTDYYMYWNKNNQIYRNALRINTKNNFNENLRLYDMKVFFVKTLGYFKHSKDIKCESYFSNCYSKNKKITDLDLDLLKYHYSYGICKGTSLKVFKEQHKRAKETLKNKKTKVRFFHQY